MKSTSASETPKWRAANAVMRLRILAAAFCAAIRAAVHDPMPDADQLQSRGMSLDPAQGIGDRLPVIGDLVDLPQVGIAVGRRRRYRGTESRRRTDTGYLTA